MIRNLLRSYPKVNRGKLLFQRNTHVCSWKRANVHICYSSKYDNRWVDICDCNLRWFFPSWILHFKPSSKLHLKFKLKRCKWQLFYKFVFAICNDYLWYKSQFFSINETNYSINKICKHFFSLYCLYHRFIKNANSKPPKDDVG